MHVRRLVAFQLMIRGIQVTIVAMIVLESLSPPFSARMGALQGEKS